jgi:hypothetical protein
MSVSAPFKANARLSVTPTAPAHGVLLWAWAEVTGRSMSGLAAMLLENGITQALRDGDVPKEAVQAMERYQSAQAVRLEDEFQAFMAVEGHPPAKSRRTAAELLQMLEPRLQPERLRQLLQNATPELRHWLKAYLEHVRRHPDGEAAREAGGEVVGFLFQELRQAHSDLADDDFKAMVLMALDEGVELSVDGAGSKG